MENKIQSLLCELKICDKDSIVPFYPKVRDRDDISVLKCQTSGVIFLSRSDHINISHYEEQESFGYWGPEDRKQAVIRGLGDDKRRFNQFQEVISNKIWLDVGTGPGGILDLLGPVALRTLAVEPQKRGRQSLIDCGYEVFPSVNEVPRNDIDVVTLFHVFEHFIDPIGELRNIKEKMKEGAKIIIEVPHANDFLISFLDIDAFKAFTFWSEHLILHTRQSLKIFLETAGFKDICINGFQRYPLANHLYWLAKGKPGGHLHWRNLKTPELELAYANMLSSLDKTDTLIAIAKT